MTPPRTGLFLTVAAAADTLALRPYDVVALIETGELDAAEIDSRLMVHAPSLDSYRNRTGR